MNNGDGPLQSPFTSYNTTRWLGRSKTIYNILTNWWEFQAFFEVESQNASVRDRYRAREIANMLKDQRNLLYFEFLCPIIQELEKLNAKFQTSSPDMDYLMKLLDMHYKSVYTRQI